MGKLIILRQVQAIAQYCDITDEYIIDRIRYGLEVLYNESSKIMLLFLISYYFKFLDYFFLLMILLSCRALLGGSHCKSYSSCLISTVFSTTLFLIIGKSITYVNFKFQFITLCILSILTLLKKDLVNINRPKRTPQYRYLEKILAISILIIVFIVTNFFLSYYLINSSFFISSLILIDYLFHKNWRNKKNVI